MAPRGMVHALTDARRVLTKKGLVVEVHPEPVEPIVLCEVPAGRLIVGRLRRHNDAYRAAEERLQRVVEQDLYRLRASVLFHFLQHTGSLRSLRAFLAGEPSRPVMDRATVGRIRSLLGPRAVGTLIVDELAHVSVIEKT